MSTDRFRPFEHSLPPDLTPKGADLSLEKVLVWLATLRNSGAPGTATLDLASRPTDGFGANAQHPEYGSAGQQLIRLAPASFDDNGETLAGQDRPNPREISNALMRQDGDMPNSHGASAFFWVWGQFLDHDLDLTEAGHTTPAPIPVPAGDPFFDPNGTGTATIGFFRVDPMNAPGEGEVRQYANEITAFIDASHIYGSSDETLEKMRVEGGKLRMTEEAFLETEGEKILTGDVRAAENVALLSMHTLFTREHNRWVEELAAQHPGLSDDELFLAARVRVEALMQAVTYNEFLPLLLGDALPDYQGYDPEVNPGISVEFSTAVFRLGHSLLSPQIQRLDETGAEHTTGNLALRDAFFAPSELLNSGIDPILRGIADGYSQELDLHLVEDVRSFLFGPPGAGGFDLAALNIQRGRDLGIPTYNGLREALPGLDPVTSFSEITSDPEIAARLEALYGDVDLVDAWIGGLAEDPVNGGMVGETFSAVLVDQFVRLRAGDPFWSEIRELSAEEQAELWSTRLSDIIMRNTGIEHIQRDVMVAYDRQGGTDEADRLIGDEGRDLLLGFDGHDLLFGRAGDDELVGGAGKDKLFGGPGNDLMFGGPDADKFFFNGRNMGNQTIADFEPGVDRAVFRNVDWRDASIDIVGRNVVLSFEDGGSVTFEDVGLTQSAAEALLL